MKYSEWANLQRNIVDQWLVDWEGKEGGQGVMLMGIRLLYWDDENVLKLDYGDHT